MNSTFLPCALPARRAAGKPAPDVYLKVAEDLKVRPETGLLVFEDVPKGIEAGKNAGMSVCAVDDDFSRTG